MRGTIKAMTRAMAWAAAAVLLASCATTAADGYATYDTAGEPKALGMRVQVSYPSGWTVEGDDARSTIIRTFRHEAEGYRTHLLIQAQALGEDAALLFGDAAGFDGSPRRAKWMHVLANVSGTRVSGLKAATHAGRPAVVADLVVSGEGGQGETHLASRMLMVREKDNMVVLTCGVSGTQGGEEGVVSRQKAQEESVCRAYFDSLAFID